MFGRDGLEGCSNPFWTRRFEQEVYILESRRPREVN